MGLFGIHRHTWRPLKVAYRYRDWRRGKSQIVTVRRCQCRKCGKVAHVHFAGKDVVESC